MTEPKPTGLPEGGKARRVYLHLRDGIARGSYLADSLLPGEERLAREFDVSRVTIRRALKALEDDGLINRRAGSGTRVLARPDGHAPIGAEMTTLLPQLDEMSRKTTIRLLSVQYGTAPAPVVLALDLEKGAQVQIATRVRLIEDQPFSYLVTYVPEDISHRFDDRDLATTALFLLLEQGGIRIAGAEQTVSAQLAAPDVAAALDVSVGSALLSLNRVVKDRQGRGVEYLSALYRPDLFQLDMSLARVGRASNRHWEPRIGRTRDKS
ncbi:MAG: GntR family transcriptional regulator [Arenibacterium sp.]